MTEVSSDNSHDASADQTIRDCLALDNPKSFFLYAGAGSGKTRSLVNAIRDLLEKQGRQLVLTGRKVAVITYTNAACDEIKQRLEFDPRIDVSTIHSFAWSLIGGYDNDIREWLDARLLEDIAELEEKTKKRDEQEMPRLSVHSQSKARHVEEQCLVKSSASSTARRVTIGHAMRSTILK